MDPLAFKPYRLFELPNWWQCVNVVLGSWFGPLEKNMVAVNFEQVFDRASKLANHTTLTVTEAPEHEQELLGLLERALMRGLRNHTQLTKIHLPFERFPFMDSKFWHIPVEDSGDAGVLRFFFETTHLSADQSH